MLHWIGWPRRTDDLRTCLCIKTTHLPISYFNTLCRIPSPLPIYRRCLLPALAIFSPCSAANCSAPSRLKSESSHMLAKPLSANGSTALTASCGLVLQNIQFFPEVSLLSFASVCPGIRILRLSRHSVPSNVTKIVFILDVVSIVAGSTRV